MLCFSLGSRLRGNDGLSPWDPLLISPWEGEGDGSREGDLTACFAILWVPASAGKTVLPAGRIRGGSRTAPTGWTEGEGTVVVGGVCCDAVV